METILKLDLTVDEDDIERGAREILKSVRPQWNPSELTFKIFTDGITNKLMACQLKDDSTDVVLVRVYGQNTDLLIDRKAEADNFRLLHKSGYAPHLYAIFQNGLAYEFVPGQIVTAATVRMPHVYPLIASMMAKIHSIPQTNKNPCVWPKIEQYLDLIPETYNMEAKQKFFMVNFPSKEEIKNEYLDLKMKLSLEKSPVVFCHNDLLLANIIHRKNQVTFIDYEYAGCNYQAFDIGNHFAEFAGVTQVDYSLYPDKEFQYEWLRVYLQQFKSCDEVDDAEIDLLYAQVNKFVLATHLYWATWALVQGQHSTINFDYLSYGAIRMKEYLNIKDKVL